MRAAELLVATLGIYCAIGIGFALASVFRGVNRADELAENSVAGSGW